VEADRLSDSNSDVREEQQVTDDAGVELLFLRVHEVTDQGCYLVGFGIEGEVSGVEYVDLSAVARERSTAACGSKEAVPFQGGEFLRKL
jgi:hypothetical protein